jgi:hypothetical protein
LACGAAAAGVAIAPRQGSSPTINIPINKILPNLCIFFSLYIEFLYYLIDISHSICHT